MTTEDQQPHGSVPPEEFLYAEIVQGEDPPDFDERLHMIAVPESTMYEGDPRNPTWAEYRTVCPPEDRPRIEAIRAAIVREGLVGVTADEFCNDHYFALSDGTYCCFTWRMWGSLMQTIVGTREGYMKYYMRRG